MARSARNARQQAARAGLLTLVAAGCAAMQEPPGGPPDFDPPVLLTVRPDSGAVVPAYRDPVRFEFDEIVSEQQGRLRDYVLISPRPRDTDVSWKRSAIEVRPDGGWQRDVVYQVALLPGITDLRNNRMRGETRIVFSTGGDIPATRVAGLVLDWDSHRAAPGALVEALRLPDSLVWVTRADSTGAFVLEALAPGTYHLIATVDGNSNLRRDRREPFDSLEVALDSVVDRVFWAFVHDTTGPGLRTATLADSMTVRIQFNQKLRPDNPDTAAVSVVLLPDSTPVAIASVWRPAVYDSVRAVEDSLRRAAADSAAADTTAAPAAPAAPAPPATPPRAGAAGAAGGAGAADSLAADTSRADSLLAARTRLSDSWVIRLVNALTPGARYVIHARAANPNGAVAESRAVLVVPADTTAPDGEP